MVAAILALVLIRLEREGEAAREDSALLTETFIDDMNATLRQIGIGDFVVGKHVGRMVSALGGRLAALREQDLAAAVDRNIFRCAAPSAEAVAVVAARLERLRQALEGMEHSRLLAGELPAL
jgi:cytochrome b pre-mRNA-processing protein 3